MLKNTTQQLPCSLHTLCEIHSQEKVFIPPNTFFVACLTWSFMFSMFTESQQSGYIQEWHICKVGSGFVMIFTVHHAYRLQQSHLHSNKCVSAQIHVRAGADPGYVKRGGRDPKGGAGDWYNPKIAQKWPKIGWICMIYLSKGGPVPIRTIRGSAPEELK